MDYKNIQGYLKKVNIELLAKAGFLGDDLITLTLKSEDISSRLTNYGLSEAYVTKIRNDTEPLDEEHSKPSDSYFVYVEVHRPDNSKKSNNSGERIDLYLRKIDFNNENISSPEMLKQLAKETVKTANRIYARDLESRLKTLLS